MPASTDGIIFNELHMNPGSTGGQDANGDGSLDSQDGAVELLNTGASAVDLTGWELWYVVNNAGVAEQLATLNSFSLAPGAYYTIVEASGSFTDLSNVGDGEQADAAWMPNSQSTYALYNPDNNEYILISGASEAGSEATMIAAIEAAHTGATQSGTTESYFINLTAASAARVTDASDTWVLDDGSLGMANCFAAGMQIATRGGEVAVEALAIGDLVRTADGRDVPVKWIGRQTIVKAFAGERAQLVCIAAGTLGNHSDLLVTGEHGMVVDGMVINAAALVNGTTVSMVPLAETEDRFTVYHVETEAHDVILANGAASESYLDVPGRKAFDNYAEYLTLYGAEEPMRENPMPRVASARLVPDALRARLAG